MEEEHDSDEFDIPQDDDWYTSESFTRRVLLHSFMVCTLKTKILLIRTNGGYVG